MAKYGSDDLEITFGGTSLKNYIDTINGFNIEAMLQEGHAFGDTWVEQLATGIKRADPLTVEGFYDDTVTTGPDAILNTLGTTIAIIITYGASKTSTFSAIVTSYNRTPVRGEITRFSATLTPTGAVTEA